MNDQDLVQPLQVRMNRMELRLKLATWGGLGALAGLVLLTLSAPAALTQSDTLRLRQLIIVDEKGTDRVVIGAPVPHPLMGGRRQERRSPATGLAINDADGDERGGFGMLADGTMSTCLDSTAGEGVCLFILPSGTAGLLVNDQQGNQRAVLGITSSKGEVFAPLGGADHSGLVLRDNKGRMRFWLRLNADGIAKLEARDEAGQPLFMLPETEPPGQQ